jgi:restriction system protein
MEVLIILVLLIAVVVTVLSKKERKLKEDERSIVDTINKGKEYELKVGYYYKNLGYEVIQHGIEKGKQDNGIDVIAKKENEILLIQCKDYKKDFSIGEKLVHQFYGACHYYELKNNLDGNITKYIFAVTGHNKIHNKAKSLFKLDIQKCKYQVID